MNTVIDYIILTSGDNYSLSEQVDKRIKDGWQPYGHLQIITDKTIKRDDETINYNIYCQAMVKYAKQ